MKDMPNYKEIAERVRILVGKGDADKVIRFLRTVDVPFIEDELRVIEGRYNRVRKAIRGGTIEGSLGNVELNRINESFIDLAREIEKMPLQNKLAESEKKPTLNKSASSSGLLYKIGGAIVVLSLLGFFAFRFINNQNQNKNNQTQLKRLLKEAQEEMLEKDLLAAKVSYDSALYFIGKLEDKKKKDNVDRMLQNVEDQLSIHDSIVSLADELYANKEFAESLDTYEKALTYLPKDSSDIGKQIGLCKAGILEEYKGLVKSAKSAFGSKNYTLAISRYKEADFLLSSGPSKEMIIKGIKNAEKGVRNNNPTYIKSWEMVYMSTVFKGKKLYITTRSKDDGSPVFVSELEGRKNAQQAFFPRRYHGRGFDEYVFSSGLQDFRVMGASPKDLGDPITIQYWDHGRYWFRWKFEPVEGKGFKLRNSHKGSYLGIDSNGNLITVSEDKSPIWLLENYANLGF